MTRVAALRQSVKVVSCIALLAGCGSLHSPENFVAEAHRRYEWDYLNNKNFEPDAAQDRRTNVLTATKRARRPRMPLDPRPTGSVNPPSETPPFVGSPEWSRQEAETQRREELVKRSMRICKGC